MANNLLPPGFKDELSQQSSTENKFKNIIINIFQTNGYELVKTPLIEYSNNDNKSNSFVINELSEKKELILRSDITMQIARLSYNRLKKMARPLKLCYYGDVVRKKGSLLRPERQFLQVGAECIGEQSYLADIEMLDLAYQSLSSVGIKDISIELSSHIFLNYLLKNYENKNQKIIRSFIRKKDLKNSLKYLDNDLHKFATNLLSCSGVLKDKKIFLNNLIINDETKKAVNEIFNIYYGFLKKYPKVKFVCDLTESDYLDYHTGTRFTIFAKNVRGEVARGGRYKFKNGFKNEFSTGFNCYMDSILRASSSLEKIKKIIVPFELSKKIKNQLIKKGYIIDTYFGDLSKIKKFAKDKGVNAVFIKNKIIKIKSR